MTNKRGPKRGINPDIPKHIDQSKIPTGVYFDSRGRGRWYTRYRDEAGKLKKQHLADASVTLAELHRIIEVQRGIDRHTLAYLCNQYHQSAKFKGLAAKTRSDYEYCRDVLCSMKTRIGPDLGALSVHRFTPAMIQRIVDKTADEGTPSKANHLLRYLRLLFRWGINRGFCELNPAAGVESAKERKQRRLPTDKDMDALISYAQAKGCDYPTRGVIGSCPTYLWIVMELAYLCRLRGIEVVTLTDANETPEGVLTNRRKGSRDNIVQWTPRLRKAWKAAQERRAKIWEKRGRATPLKAQYRPLIVSRNGDALRKSAYDSSWQRFIRSAINAEIIDASTRFATHDLKRRGITDTEGNLHDKQHASGHRSPQMMDIYDLSVPLVKTPERVEKEKNFPQQFPPKA